MALPSLTLRLVKGAPVSFAEMDTNLTNLQTATIGITTGSNAGVLSLNDTLTVQAGSNVSVSLNTSTKTLTISASASASSTATTSTVGLVKVSPNPSAIGIQTDGTLVSQLNPISGTGTSVVVAWNSTGTTYDFKWNLNVATSATIGGVKQGANILIDAGTGIIRQQYSNSYGQGLGFVDSAANTVTNVITRTVSASTATTATFGVVKVDGTTIAATNGVISTIGGGTTEIFYKTTGTISTASSTTAILALLTDNDNKPAYYSTTASQWLYIYNNAQVVATYVAPVTTSTILLHAEAMTDSSPNNITVTASGTAASTSTQFKFGSKSFYLDGTATGHIDLAYNANQNLGAGNFTIEFWFYRLTGGGANRVHMGIWGTLATDQSWIFRDDNLIQLCDNAGNYTNFTPTIANTTYSSWMHYALVRNGSTLTLYENGTSVGSTTYSATFRPVTTQGLNIGWNKNAGANTAFTPKGYYDEIRILVGTAAYTANFTPPAAAFTA